jgi:hypothetical protein
MMFWMKGWAANPVDAAADRERPQRAVAHRQAAEFHDALGQRLFAGDDARKPEEIACPTAHRLCF